MVKGSGLLWLALLLLDAKADTSEVKAASPGALGGKGFTSSVNGPNQSSTGKKWARHTLDIVFTLQRLEEGGGCCVCD